MITSINVTNVAAKVAAGRARRWLCIQNRSDVPVAVKFDGGEDSLTYANGILLQPGVILPLTNTGTDQEFFHDIYAIHNSGAVDAPIVIHER